MWSNFMSILLDFYLNPVTWDIEKNDSKRKEICDN